MEFADLLSSARWEILAALSHGEAQASQLAKKTGLSPATISQETRLLEALGYLKRKSLPHEGKGKPRQAYTLAKERGFLALLSNGRAAQKTFKLDEFHKAIMNIWLLEKEHYWLEKYFWQQELLVNECLALAVTDVLPKEIHVLVVAPEEKVEKLRKEFSKVVTQNPDGEEKSIIAWTHSEAELATGLEKKEEYFVNLVSKAHVIIDKTGVCDKLCNKEEETKK